MSIATVTMMDFTGSDRNFAFLSSLKPHKVAGYVTGPDIAWSNTEWAMFPEDQCGHVRIDQSDGLALLAGNHADVGDVETGAGTIEHFADAAIRRRNTWGITTTLYISAAKANTAHAYLTSRGIIDHVLWWVADWNLSLQEATARITGNVVAIQWASPTSNPHTLVPGSNSTTLSQANIDLSVARADWIPPKPKAPPPPPTTLELSVTPKFVTANGGWTEIPEADHYVITGWDGSVLARTVDNHFSALAIPITVGKPVIVKVTGIVHSKPVVVGTWQMK